jgi:adenylate kinase
MGFGMKQEKQGRELQKNMERFTGQKYREDANELLVRSHRLVKLAKRFYQQSGNIRDVMYLMAREQGLMLNEDQVRAMVNKYRKKNHIIEQ